MGISFLLSFVFRFSSFQAICKASSDSHFAFLHLFFGGMICIGEGNGNPLHCSCLENPRDGGAWWAAIYGVAQSWTQLK